MELRASGQEVWGRKTALRSRDWSFEVAEVWSINNEEKQ
jgi:hypothetical protein